MTILLCAIALTEAPFVAMWLFQDRAEAAHSTVGSVGTVYVESEPAGLEVMVNGIAAGYTPAQLSLPAGTVELQLRHAGSVRVVPLVVNPDETMRLRVEFSATTESLQSSAPAVVAPSVTTLAPVERPGSFAPASHLPLP